MSHSFQGMACRDCGRVGPVRPEGNDCHACGSPETITVDLLLPIIELTLRGQRRRGSSQDQPSGGQVVDFEKYVIRLRERRAQANEREARKIPEITRPEPRCPPSRY